MLRTPALLSVASLRSSYRGTSLIRNTPTWDPTVALCLGTYGDPRGVGVSYERGTLVHGVVSAGSGALGKGPVDDGLFRIKTLRVRVYGLGFGV